MNPVPAGYSDLGTTVASAGGKSGYYIGPIENPAVRSASIVSLTHSKAVFAARADPYEVEASDCAGSGDAPEHPVTVQHLADPRDEVRAGIACAEFRNPGAIWVAVRLVRSVIEDRYLTIVALVDPQMRPFEVYAETSRFVHSIQATP